MLSHGIMKWIQEMNGKERKKIVQNWIQREKHYHVEYHGNPMIDLVIKLNLDNNLFTSRIYIERETNIHDGSERVEDGNYHHHQIYR